MNVIILGLMAIWQTTVVGVQKMDKLNQNMEQIELVQYENQLAKEYGIREIKRIRMGEAFNYQGFYRTEDAGRYQIGR